ncbi:hypothetical protein [Mesorhizobium sp. ESP-6-2]|uniref:hypothetical protein n=1 Tax=Mesorhizobium sp. ESP-6-2 TaxID=2876625 RepID=UPI001CC90AC5|nr:hypothetical protein [Mesorhizobium sp. ESP-6-2]MBZ9808108.1 hypothetical protein [Mesorhizobium sp. ESP-6-2]
MLVSTEKLLQVLRKVRQLREEYRSYVLGGDANMVSIEDLQRCIEQMYELEIIKTQVVFTSTFTRGLMERYKNKVIIRVKHDQTDDHKRFTATKEMCHPVVDEKEDWSTDGVGRIQDLLIEFEVTNGEAPHQATQSEVLAEIAAIEVLYPYECRGIDLQRLARGETTLVKIATYHRVPATVVSRALADQYHQLITGLWGQI